MVALLDDCCHRAVVKSAVVGATLYVHRDPSTTEAQASPTIAITVEPDINFGRLVVTAQGISSAEHTLLDFMFMPMHKHTKKGFTGQPTHLIQRLGARFESKSQTRTLNGNRQRQNRSTRDPTHRRYTPAPAPAAPARLLSRAQIGLRKLIQKTQRPRTQARNALDEPIPVIIPEVESSDSDTSSEAADQ